MINSLHVYTYIRVIICQIETKDGKPLTRKRRNIFLISEPPVPSSPAADRRDDPYGSIGHYPELHMDIHELEHHEIDSEHEGHFGSCGYGGGYGWCPDGFGKLERLCSLVW